MLKNSFDIAILALSIGDALKAYQKIEFYIRRMVLDDTLLICFFSLPETVKDNENVDSPNGGFIISNCFYFLTFCNQHEKFSGLFFRSEKMSDLFQLLSCLTAVLWTLLANKSSSLVDLSYLFL